MTRIALAVVAWLALVSVATSAQAQSHLINGVYTVTVTGTTARMGGFDAAIPFVLPGYLFVYPSVAPERPAEMCLFINLPPAQLPTEYGSNGASWLASRLGCGGSSAKRGAAFSSITDALVGGVRTFGDVIVIIPPSREESVESLQAYENILLTSTQETQSPACILTRCDPPKKIRNLATGGWWAATTSDKGETVVGAIQLQGVELGTNPLEPANYTATFKGNLVLRMQ
jgi:hypothetical protein